MKSNCVQRMLLDQIFKITKSDESIKEYLKDNESLNTKDCDILII